MPLKPSFQNPLVNGLPVALDAFLPGPSDFSSAEKWERTLSVVRLIEELR